MVTNRRGLFLFHRDLRIIDNIGLTSASKDCHHLYTAFVFTPEQVSKANRFKSNNAVQFMIESLDDMAKQLHKNRGELLTFYGKTHQILAQLISKLDIQCIYFNEDYTPYARARQTAIMQLCQHAKIECKTYHDYYLLEPGTVRNGQGGVYQKFTPFYEAYHDKKIAAPNRSIISNFAKPTSSIKFDHRITIENAKHVFLEKLSASSPIIAVHGGRDQALVQLRKAVNNLAEYKNTRDIMSEETTMLSAAIKFGCISIREVYGAFYRKYGRRHEVLRQLIWRDFFAHLLYAHPETLTKMYYPKYNRIRWRTNASHLQSWKTGTTGFPLVDAAMRQLNQTGYMHNRGRMMVANFLVKTLLLDWREGERYFAEQLTDYDPASNSGNWHSIVGGGAYASAWFRDMNPWIQSAKFDKSAIYIKRWIPELSEVDARDIHRWSISWSNPKNKDVKYDRPIVDYTEQKAKFMDLYDKYL